MHTSSQPIVNTTRLGMLLFLTAEAMFFTGLLSAYLVFRMGSVTWPPFGQPRLPVLVTGINTALFILSVYTLHQAYHFVRAGVPQQAARWLYPTIALGVCFLGIQGYEWLRLIYFGFTLSSGAYGFTFYTIVGFHALHVTAAVIWLIVVLIKTSLGHFSAEDHNGFDACRMYWYFVVGLWPVLYGLVYVF